MKNCIKYQALATQQLQLFTIPPTPSDSPPAYPLQIGYISDKERVAPDKFCQLIHHGHLTVLGQPQHPCPHESGLNISGMFSYPEAKEILEITRYWDWELDRDKIPRCIEKFKSLLENIGTRSIYCTSFDLGGVA